MKGLSAKTRVGSRQFVVWFGFWLFARSLHFDRDPHVANSASAEKAPQDDGSLCVWFGLWLFAGSLQID